MSSQKLAPVLVLAIYITVNRENVFNPYPS